MTDKGTLKNVFVPQNTVKLNNRDAFLGPQLPVSANFDDFEQEDIGFPSQNENRIPADISKPNANENIKIINGDNRDRQTNVARNEMQQMIKGIIVQEYQRIRQEVHQAASQYLAQQQAKSNQQIEQVSAVAGDMQNSRIDLKRLLNFELYVQGQLQQLLSQKEQMLESAINSQIMNQMDKHIVQSVEYEQEIGDFRQQVEQTLREQKQAIETTFNQYGKKQETILIQMTKDLDLNTQNLANQTQQIEQRVEQIETKFEKSLEQAQVQMTSRQAQRLENVQKQLTQMSNSLQNKVDISRFKPLMDDYFSNTYSNYNKMIQEVKDKCEKLEKKENTSEQNAGERMEVIEETNSIKIAGIKEEFSELLKKKENRMNQIAENLNQNRKHLSLLQTQLGKLYAKGGRKVDLSDSLGGQDLIQNTSSVKAQCEKLLIKSKTVFKALNDLTQTLINENNQLKSSKEQEQENKNKVSSNKRWKIPASALQLPFQPKSQEQKQTNDSQSSNLLPVSHLQEKQEIQIDSKFNNAGISQAEFAMFQTTGRLKHSPFVIETLRQNEIIASQLEELQSKSTDANSKQEDMSSNQLHGQLQQQDLLSNEGFMQQNTIQPNELNLQRQSNTDLQETQLLDQHNQYQFNDSLSKSTPNPQAFYIQSSLENGTQVLKPINIVVGSQQNQVGQPQTTESDKTPLIVQSPQQRSIDQTGQDIRTPLERESTRNSLLNDQTDYQEKLQHENKQLMEQREQLLNEQATIQKNLLCMEVKNRLHSKSADSSEIFYQKETIPPSESVLKPKKQTNNPSELTSPQQINKKAIIFQQRPQIVLQQSPHHRLSVSPAVASPQHSQQLSPKQILRITNNKTIFNDKLPQINQQRISHPLQSNPSYSSQQIPQVLPNSPLMAPLQQEISVNQHFYNTQPSSQEQQCFDPFQQIQNRQFERTHSYDPEFPSFSNPNNESPVFIHQLKSPKNQKQDQITPLFSQIAPLAKNNFIPSQTIVNPENRAQPLSSAPLLFNSVSPRNNRQDQFLPLFSENKVHSSNQIISIPSKRQEMQIAPEKQINIDRKPRFGERSAEENKQENSNINLQRTNVSPAERNRNINSNVKRLSHLLDLSANSRRKDEQTSIAAVRQQYQTSPTISRKVIQAQQPESNSGSVINTNRESQSNLTQKPQVNSLQIPDMPQIKEHIKDKQIQQEKKKLLLTNEEIALEKIIKRRLLFNNKTYGAQSKKLVLKADSAGKYQDMYNKYIFEESGSILELKAHQIAFLKQQEIAEFI